MKINTLVIASVLVAAFASTSAVQAGTKTSNEVKITDSQRRAEGSLGSARASADTNQYLACTVHSSASDIYMSCSARDASGLFRSCASSSDTLVQAALSLSASSMIVFTWDANYACQTLDVANGSLYLPTSP